ncbi:MAG: TIR domain-containing protein, partial [Clostridiales bacterium]|nr:TIR domain-containing protein [Clostridiales bacterium]
MGCDVFISYRRDFGAERAENVYKELKDDFKVFWDQEAMLAETFTERIKNEIESCEYFIVILSKGFFDRCKNSDDVVRMELQTAVGDIGKKGQEESPKKRTIIPIFMDDISQKELKKIFAGDEFFNVISKVLGENGVDFNVAKTKYWGQELKSLILNKFAQTSVCREKIKNHYDRLEKACDKIKYFEFKFDDIYVEQMLESIPDREENGGRGMPNGGKSGGVLKPLELLKKSGVDVVMGAAGAGKSLIIQSMALYILKQSATKALEKDFELPVYIELKDYRDKRSGNNDKQYFLSKYIDEKIFESVSGKIDGLKGYVKWVLLFDGIDELADLGAFEAIRKDIEDFVISQGKEHCKVIFSSRSTCSLVEGNNKFSVNGEKINKYKVRDLGYEEQIEYIDKYFNASGIKEGEPVEVTGKKQEEFKSALKKAEEKDKKFIELSRSPFLLAQIIKIYRAGGALSENKIDIYNECAKLLVDDKKFDILPDELKEKNTILAVLGHLAYTLYTAETAAKDGKTKVVGLSSKDVKKEIEGYMGYLFKKDEKISATFTEKFFEYVKRCSIYTDDRFLHQTFEEYFTACHLYSAARQKESVKVGLKILEKVTIDDTVIDEIITQYKGSEYWKAIV